MVAGRSLWQKGGAYGSREEPMAAERSLWQQGGAYGSREEPMAAGRSLWRQGGAYGTNSRVPQAASIHDPLQSELCFSHLSHVINVCTLFCGRCVCAPDPLNVTKQGHVHHRHYILLYLHVLYISIYIYAYIFIYAPHLFGWSLGRATQDSRQEHWTANPGNRG